MRGSDGSCAALVLKPMPLTALTQTLLFSYCRLTALVARQTTSIIQPTTASISTAAPSGSAATAIAVRAGYGASKCLTYTSFIAA